MDLKELITTLVEEKTKGTPYFMVGLKVSSTGKEISVFLDADMPLDIDYCAEMSRYLGEHLDSVEGTAENYSLIVSSPGAEQALRNPRQYAKHVGRELKVNLLDDEEKKGELMEVSSIGITITQKVKEKGKKAVAVPVTIGFDEIKESKVVISFK